MHYSCNYHLQQEVAMWLLNPLKVHAGLHMPKIHTAFISILGTKNKKQIQAKTAEAVFCDCKHFHY